MIRLALHGRDGRKLDVYLESRSILEVEEASVSQKWHGVRSNIRLNGGNWQEVRESNEAIAELINEAGS